MAAIGEANRVVTIAVYGYLHVVGEIQNGTTESLTYVKATATFYDKNNKVEST